jgi:hypothetical protein
MDNGRTGIIVTRSGKKLTKKQARFIKAITDPNIASGAEAVRIAGYKAKDAKGRAVLANENINKPYIQEAVQDELNKQGLSISDSVDKLHTSIDAGIGVKATNKDSLKGLEMVFKLHGLLENKKTVENKKLTLNLKVKDMEELRQVLNGKKSGIDGIIK